MPAKYSTKGNVERKTAVKIRGDRQEGYESDWNGGERCSGSGEMAQHDSTSCPLRIWTAKVSI